MGQTAYRMALRPLRQLYGDTPAADFGPLALKVVRDSMVQEDWCRRVVNQMTNLVRGVFNWAASEQLIPIAAYQSLQTVTALKKGRSDARETEPRHPAPNAHVAAIAPFVSRQVWAIVQLQLVTGARSG